MKARKSRNYCSRGRPNNNIKTEFLHLGGGYICTYVKNPSSSTPGLGHLFTLLYVTFNLKNTSRQQEALLIALGHI